MSNEVVKDPDMREWDVITKAFFIEVTGKTLNAHRQVIERLTTGNRPLTEATSPEDSDVIIVFCPITSRVGTVIKAGLENISAMDKPIVLVVLHHTLSPDYHVPDTRRHVTHTRVQLTVDLLFHETMNGLLNCPHNDQAMETITQHLDICPGASTQDGWYPAFLTNLLQNVLLYFSPALPIRAEAGTLYRVVSGKTLDSDTHIVQHLTAKDMLKEVTSQDQCDHILVFCSVTSQTERDIEAALDKVPVGKPTVLVVLHHTFDPDQSVPDSSGLVTRADVKVTVDCLFHETQGLLPCPRNEQSIRKILEALNVDPEKRPWMSENPTNVENSTFMTVISNLQVFFSSFFRRDPEEAAVDNPDGTPHQHVSPPDDRTSTHEPASKESD